MKDKYKRIMATPFGLAHTRTLHYMLTNIITYQLTTPTLAETPLHLPLSQLLKTSKT